MHASQVALDEGESEGIRCLAVTLMSQADTPAYIQYLGGPVCYINTLQKLLDVSFQKSDKHGLGCQLDLLDVTCRAIALLSFSQAGQAALIQTHASSKLFGILRREILVRAPNLVQNPSTLHRRGLVSTAILNDILNGIIPCKSPPSKETPCM